MVGLIEAVRTESHPPVTGNRGAFDLGVHTNLEFNWGQGLLCCIGVRKWRVYG